MHQLGWDTDSGPQNLSSPLSAPGVDSPSPTRGRHPKSASRFNTMVRPASLPDTSRRVSTPPLGIA